MLYSLLVGDARWVESQLAGAASLPPFVRPSVRGRKVERGGPWFALGLTNARSIGYVRYVCWPRCCIKFLHGEQKSFMTGGDGKDMLYLLYPPLIVRTFRVPRVSLIFTPSAVICLRPKQCRSNRLQTHGLMAPPRRAAIVRTASPVVDGDGDGGVVDTRRRQGH